ncbi:MAG: hypothetical protein Kow0074_08240 [Candidatus Zixiibacteriota bacterium]
MDGSEFQAGSQASKLEAAARSSIPATRLVYTFGQAVLAKGQITNTIDGTAVKIGLGYDFNAQNTTHWGCTCPNQGNLAGGEEDDVNDIAAVIDALFFNGDSPQDPLCPAARVDVNCDDFSTAEDLVIIIDLVLNGTGEPCQPCAAE